MPHHSAVHKGICNSHFDKGVCNGASLILKLDKILLIVMGVTIAYWKHWSTTAIRELEGSFSIRSGQEDGRFANLESWKL